MSKIGFCWLPQGTWKIVVSHFYGNCPHFGNRAWSEKTRPNFYRYRCNKRLTGHINIHMKSSIIFSMIFSVAKAFIILQSSFLHFVTFKLFSLFTSQSVSYIIHILFREWNYMLIEGILCINYSANETRYILIERI